MSLPTAAIAAVRELVAAPTTMAAAPADAVVVAAAAVDAAADDAAAATTLAAGGMENDELSSVPEGEAGGKGESGEGGGGGGGGGPLGDLVLSNRRAPPHELPWPLPAGRPAVAARQRRAMPRRAGVAHWWERAACMFLFVSFPNAPPKSYC